MEACAILTNKMHNYFSSASEYYMPLLTSDEYFDYPKLVCQIQRISDQGREIPHFIPYFNKIEKQLVKSLTRAAEQGIKVAPPDALFATEDLDKSCILRFDYIIRKVMKLCGNDSTENFNENTISMVWFFTLDSMLGIKERQIKVLQKLK